MRTSSSKRMASCKLAALPWTPNPGGISGQGMPFTLQNLPEQLPLRPRVADTKGSSPLGFVKVRGQVCPRRGSPESPCPGTRAKAMLLEALEMETCPKSHVSRVFVQRSVKSLEPSFIVHRVPGFLLPYLLPWHLDFWPL